MPIKNKEQETKQGFMQRWSNKKIESKTNVDIKLEKEGISSAALAEASNSESKPSESNFSELNPSLQKSDEDMPPLEQLNEESDYSDFLSPNVSDALRKQALRKLFHMPFLNVVDGLDDYAEDYTKFAALGDIIPHEMQRMMDREKKKEMEQQALEMQEQEKQAQQQQALNDEQLNEISEEDTTENPEDNDNEELKVSNVNVEDNGMTTTDELINLKDKTNNEKLN